MLEQLAAIGAERGVRRFDAAVLVANRPMLRVFRNAGFAVNRAVLEELNVSVDITPLDAVVQRIDGAKVPFRCAGFAATNPRSVVGRGHRGGQAGKRGALVGREHPQRRLRGVVQWVDAGVRRARRTVFAKPGRARGRSRFGHPRGRGGVRSEFRGGGCGHWGESVAGCPWPAQRRTSRHRPGLNPGCWTSSGTAGLLAVGPNSLGLINTAPQVRLNATFTSASVSSGGLAICSPSGAVGIGLLSHAAALGLGVSLFASLGNRADVSTNDLLEWCEQDRRTVAVILYVEDVRQSRAFHANRPAGSHGTSPYLPSRVGGSLRWSSRMLAPTPRRRCAATGRLPMPFCIRPDCSGSAAAMSCSTRPSPSSANRSRGSADRDRQQLRWCGDDRRRRGRCARARYGRSGRRVRTRSSCQPARDRTITEPESPDRWACPRSTTNGVLRGCSRGGPNNGGAWRRLDGLWRGSPSRLSLA